MMNSNHKIGTKDIRPFHQLPDPSKILPILEKRLPTSCFIYNAAKMSSRFPDQSSIYVLGEGIDESSWIVLTHYTENFGTNFMISADRETSKISKSEALRIFSESPLIQWKESHWFVALEKWLAEIMFEISVDIKGNIIKVYPDVIFYMEPSDCLDTDTRTGDDSLEVNRLDETLGADFIQNTWKYSVDGTDAVLRRIIKHNETGGVYLKGQPVCGVTTHGYGLLSMLYTDSAHRNKGYAKLAMKFVVKELATNGMVPASSVDVSNTASMNFHKKLGFKTVGPVNWISFSDEDNGYEKVQSKNDQ